MSGHGGAAGKRAVQKSTVDRWIAESDKTLNTSVWLTYDTDRADRSRVVALKCSICARFRDRLVGRRNYSAAYIEGSVNLRASSYKEHAASEMLASNRHHGTPIVGMGPYSCRRAMVERQEAEEC